jgi:hypothetical protein
LAHLAKNSSRPALLESVFLGSIAKSILEPFSAGRDVAKYGSIAKTMFETSAMFYGFHQRPFMGLCQQDLPENGAKMNFAMEPRTGLRLRRGLNKKNFSRDCNVRAKTTAVYRHSRRRDLLPVTG